ncbi:MAG: LPS export ABC transporter permease LptF [Gammaproteobacteria bacterium]|nr:LPS export ABC transporter permease LptF [Gammaproteobacteria bacterium]
MLPIIDRYILWEVSKAFLGITALLLLVLVGSGYLRLLGEAASGSIGQEVMLKLVGIEALRVLAPITPPAFFLAILVILGQMYRDSEMTALSASGIGSVRIFRAVFLAALPVALFVSWLSLDLRPWANDERKLLFGRQDIKAEFNAAVAGRFNEFSRGDLVFYVGGMSEDRQRLQEVFVQHRKHGKLGLIVAREGYQSLDPVTGEHFVVLTDGRRYEGVPGKNDFSIVEFEKYGLRIELEPEQRNNFRIDALPTAELLLSNELRHRVELQYRLMLPVAVLVFTFISVPLSYSLPRSGIYGRLILAILFYLLFINLLALSGAWMEAGTTPAWMGRWWVHVVMLVLAGLVMVYRSPRLNRKILRLIGRIRR